MFLAVFTLLFCFFVLSASESQPSLIGTVSGYFTHGPNNRNGQLVNDYSTVGNNILLRTTAPLYEIGALNLTSVSPDPITSSTDLSRLVATTDFLNNFFGNPQYDQSFINIPIADIGVWTPTTTVVTDRTFVKPWNNVNTRALLHSKRSTETGSAITLGEWNAASGMVTITSKDDYYSIKLEMCGFSSSIYAIFEYGITNARTDLETFYLVPAGGLPNIILTDKNGYGKTVWTSKWNPLEPCAKGANCSLDYNILYNWDYQVYGGTPTLGIPAGITHGQQIIFPLLGTPLTTANDFPGNLCV